MTINNISRTFPSHIFTSELPAMATQTTATYTAIREGRYEDAVRHLNLQRQIFPRSRAALSLLGFCYYHLQDFRSAAQTYEELVMICPDVEEYERRRRLSSRKTQRVILVGTSFTMLRLFTRLVYTPMLLAQPYE